MVFYLIGLLKSLHVDSKRNIFRMGEVVLALFVRDRQKMRTRRPRASLCILVSALAALRMIVTRTFEITRVHCSILDLH